MAAACDIAQPASLDEAEDNEDTRSNSCSNVDPYEVNVAGASEDGKSSRRSSFMVHRSIWAGLLRNNQDAWSDSGASHDDLGDRVALFHAGLNASLNHTFSTIKRNPILLLWVVLVFATTCAVGLAFTCVWANAERSGRMEEAREVAEEISDWFSSELDKALIPLYTIRQFVIQTPEFEALHNQIGFCKKLQTDNSPAECEANAAPPLPLPGKASSHRNLTGRIPDETREKFNEIAASIKKDAHLERVLVNMQLAPKAVVSLLYPMVNTEDFDAPLVLDNRGAWGHDLLNDPNRSAIAYQTVPAKTVVIAGPTQLVQSNVPVVKDALIARLPISIPGKSHSIKWTQADGMLQDHNVWGFAVVLLNWAELKKRSGLYDRFTREKMHFRLTRTDLITDPQTKAVTSKEVLIAESVNASVLMADKINVSVKLHTTNHEF
jgi:hypothetical protein